MPMTLPEDVLSDIVTRLALKSDVSVPSHHLLSLGTQIPSCAGSRPFSAFISLTVNTTNQSNHPG